MNELQKLFVFVPTGKKAAFDKVKEQYNNKVVFLQDDKSIYTQGEYFATANNESLKALEKKLTDFISAVGTPNDPSSGSTYIAKIKKLIEDTKNALLGTTTDPSTANTIHGAKKGAAEALAYAKKVESKLPEVTQGYGIKVTSSADGTGKKTFKIEANMELFTFDGQVTATGTGDTNIEADAKKFYETEHKTCDAGSTISYGTPERGYVLYTYDGKKWVVVGSAKGVSSVDTTAKLGIALTNNASVLGISVTPQTIADAAAVKKGVAEAYDVKTYVDNRDNAILSSAKTYANTIKVNNQAQSAQNITLNGSHIILTGYAEGTKTPIAATDTINGAFGKVTATMKDNTNRIVALEGSVVKTVTGDTYITASKSGNGVTLKLNPTKVFNDAVGANNVNVWETFNPSPAA